ncbi:undecaprenyl-diphosphate phosphatase [Phytohabitans flavus]|uniref:Undecaprenyl-diphosphatase n=1 Tax=Phytohabitans flavus TaxID=1076124 RepID=A0A6F8XNB4_9ACTN|nr:undecaprenyl-diphosphate phosphatase [Phytohabitans flavus]BCB75289.1 undecaprenyl-diphosphatase 1 [Phytohabitans flavus]
MRGEAVQWWQTIVLGVVEGLTEFLPVSSTGHLTITENLMHLKTDDLGVTAYTAIIQVGAIVAAIIYFWRDIVRIVVAFVTGLASAAGREQPAWRLSVAVVLGSIPIAVVGLAAKSVIESTLRSLWWVTAGLLLWSLVMVFAERVARQARKERDVTGKDGIVIGLVQCVALIPGVSRSGATISAGLLRGLDRVTATRMSFFLGIPALTAAGILEAFSARDDVASTVGWGPTALGAVVSFVVAYASIAWLLRYVSRHSIVVFAGYRVALGLLLAAGLVTGALSAT